ncbi:2-dehydropantoate 2-reductase N-terminal domain-containing protein [Streptomyces sp. NPDC020412]|uniref:lactate/malate family dehydrogenase n=1 Tax=Streptomyces sp. NPDC020412 TaxID=3365073 RepID=UPI0037B57E95
MTAVGIIGAGAIGHTVGTLLTAAGWCDRLLVTSGTAESARALVTDLEDMAQVVSSPVRPQSADLPDLRGCDAVVVCPRAPFTNGAVRDVRMAGLAANAPVIAGIARAFAGYTGTVIVVTNPVDAMTWLFTTASGVGRVYGIGSATDSARYRLTLARLLAVPVESVEGRVVGEHGDAAVVCAAATRVGGLPAAIPLRDVHDELGARPRRINAGLGRARSGPAGAVLVALTAALGLTDTVTELSVVNPDRTACRGMPLRFTAGVPTVVDPGLDPVEQRLLIDADRKIRAAHTTVRHHTEQDSAS